MSFQKQISLTTKGHGHMQDITGKRERLLLGRDQIETSVNRTSGAFGKSSD